MGVLNHLFFQKKQGGVPGREGAAIAPDRAAGLEGSRFLRYAFCVVKYKAKRTCSENKEHHVELNFS